MHTKSKNRDWRELMETSQMAQVTDRLLYTYGPIGGMHRIAQQRRKHVFAPKKGSKCFTDSDFEACAVRATKVTQNNMQHACKIV